MCLISLSSSLASIRLLENSSFIPPPFPPQCLTQFSRAPTTYLPPIPDVPPKTLAAAAITRHSPPSYPAWTAAHGDARQRLHGGGGDWAWEAAAGPGPADPFRGDWQHWEGRWGSGEELACDRA